MRLIVSLLLFVSVAASAQQFPSKPVRIIIPLPPGGSMDNTFRIISDRYQQLTGQSFVVDNRPGASGVIAAQTVMQAPADGYTLLAASVSMMSINPHMSAKLAYDPQKDFVPITNVYRTNYFWVVGPSAPVSSLKEYVAWAKG